MANAINKIELQDHNADKYYLKTSADIVLMDDGRTVQNAIDQISGISSVSLAICTTSGENSAKEVSVDNFSLIDGKSKIIIKFNFGNTALNPTLNVENTGNKPIYYKGVPIPATYISENMFMELIYHNSCWNVVGELAQAQIEALNNKVEQIITILKQTIVAQGENQA